MRFRSLYVWTVPEKQSWDGSGTVPSSSWGSVSPTILKGCFFQKWQFVHNSVCSQFSESLFAILAECSQFCWRDFKYKFKRKSITLLFWEGGGLRGTKIVNKNFVKKLAFPSFGISVGGGFEPGGPEICVNVGSGNPCVIT